LTGISPIRSFAVQNTPLNIGFDSLAAANGSCYMIGIGGCGMSGLARLLRALGVTIEGSDSTRSQTTDALIAEGVEVATEQIITELPEGVGSVIISAAVKHDHPLVLDAASKDISVFTYAEALGLTMRTMTGVVIAGTHGKSTTTAMLSAALIEAGLDPSVIVGATCPHLLDSKGNATGFRLGASRIPSGPLAGQPGLLLAEGCEFNRSFHNLRPFAAAILNLDHDHFDCYPSRGDLEESFGRYLARVRQDGVVLIDEDVPSSVVEGLEDSIRVWRTRAR